jgi:hypothetical protein
MTTGRVDGVPEIKHVEPLARLADCDERVANLPGLRVQLRILDAELAHLPSAMLRAIKFLGQTVMLGNDGALPVDAGRWRQDFASG